MLGLKYQTKVRQTYYIQCFFFSCFRSGDTLNEIKPVYTLHSVSYAAPSADLLLVKSKCVYVKLSLCSMAPVVFLHIPKAKSIKITKQYICFQHVFCIIFRPNHTVNLWCERVSKWPQWLWENIAAANIRWVMGAHFRYFSD